MTTAKLIKTLLDSKPFECFTLYGGYAMLGGETTRYEPASITEEKRNDKGRVIKAKCKYKDNSILMYTYNSNTETYKLQELIA